VIPKHFGSRSLTSIHVLTSSDLQDDGKVNKGFSPDIEIFTRSRAQWIKPVESATQADADFTKEFLAGYFG
jgi:hypothetical protein